MELTKEAYLASIFKLKALAQTDIKVKNEPNHFIYKLPNINLGLCSTLLNLHTTVNSLYTQKDFKCPLDLRKESSIYVNCTINCAKLDIGYNYNDKKIKKLIIDFQIKE